MEIPRKGLDTRKMVSKLVEMVRLKSQKMQGDPSTAFTHNEIYSDKMLSSMLLELLCESASQEDLRELWEAYKSFPDRTAIGFGGPIDLLKPIIFRASAETRAILGKEIFDFIKDSHVKRDNYLDFEKDDAFILTVLVRFL